MGIIFDSVNHRYFKDGNEKPSVGKIVNWYLNIDLSNIPVETLEKAQNRGTEIHLLVDKILTGEDFETSYSYEYNSFETLKKKYKIKADSIEQIVYGFTPAGDYCGTYDLYDSKSKILYDIKTTYDKHIEEWTYKCNLYRYALEQSGKKVKAIKNAVNRPFISDNLCNMLFNIGGIVTPYYRDSLDLISPNYKCKTRILNNKYVYEDIRYSIDE